MKKNFGWLKLGLMVVVITTMSMSAQASEVTGSLSSATTTDGNIMGTLESTSNTNIGGASGGGGSIVIPSASYGYGNNSNGGNNGLQEMKPVDNSLTYTGVGGADYGTGNVNFSKIYTPRTQSGLFAQAISLDATTSIETATFTPQIVPNEIVSTENINQAEDNMSQDGPFDFFGISIWFWMIILVLLGLIISIIYMRTL